jgi:hypothetical protein
MNSLIGKRVTSVRMIPTIETALQKQQLVERLVLELEDGSCLSVTANDPDGQTDSLSLDIKIH